jgi:hypothetical protein
LLFLARLLCNQPNNQDHFYFGVTFRQISSQFRNAAMLRTRIRLQSNTVGRVVVTCCLLTNKSCDYYFMYFQNPSDDSIRIAYASNTIVFARRWTHVLVTFDGTEIRLYQDLNFMDSEARSNHSLVW